jgi:predicted O-methyltransferase YrrM
MNIEKALAIDGWMSEPELRWLAERAEQHKIIVEIGSYLGRSTRALAENTSGIVYAIDKWTSSEELPMYDFEEEVHFSRFRRNVEDLIASGKCVPIIADHRAGVPINEIADMVFIDGSHSYEAAKDDILKWLPITRSLICGHDYDYPTVKQAIAETLGNVNAVENTNIWWKQWR